MMSFPKFILASRSPRRRDLLRERGYRFEVVPPPLAEPPSTGGISAPIQLAEALAYFKARSVFAARPDRVVLGSDTLVALDDDIFGKPADANDARRMLHRFSGTRHRVITALALLAPPPGPDEYERRLLAADTTYVTMRRLEPAEIDGYIASDEWRDKAGAYAIQESGDAFVEKIEGSLTNVIGLPMELLERMLRQLHGPDDPAGGAGP